MPKETTKVLGLMKDESGGKIMTKFVELRKKSYSYLVDGRSEERVIKRKLKFENYKNCFEATQLHNKINYLEKSKIRIDSLKNHKEFIKNNKLILKT